MVSKKIDLNGEIKHIAERLGYEFVGCDISGPADRRTVCVYIDREGGIRHEDCSSVSRMISDRIDEIEKASGDIFKSGYFIEVSSPGLERPLFTAEHYIRYTGERVEISRVGKRKLVGVIESASDDRVLIRNDAGETIEMPYSEIKRAHLIFDIAAGAPKLPSKKNKKGE